MKSPSRSSRLSRLSLLALVLTLGGGTALAASVTLTALQFPEGSSVDVPFRATGKGPEATMVGSVRFKAGQARIDVSYRGMEPALLFGGDVTSYVVWAVTRDGVTDNLGELIVRDSNDSARFATGQKAFALMVTAESFPYPERPSELVVFTSLASPSAAVSASPFSFSGFRPAPRTGFDTIAGIQYKEKIPIDIRQAERTLALAERLRAADANPGAVKEARNALAMAQDAQRAGSGKKVVSDYSRRAVSLASEAIRDAYRKADAAAAAQAEAAAAAAVEERTRAEREALARKAQEADRSRKETEQALSETEAARQRAAQTASEAEAARQRAAEAAASADRARAVSEQSRAESERARQVAEAASLQAKTDLERLATEREQLQKERDALARRLSNALSLVAETRDSARGVVLSLSSGILFDVNKSLLKQPAREALSKLAGILLMLPDMNLRVEGYTDATGSEETNRKLSAERARSVYAYLREQGIAESRMKHDGYGPSNPVASNDTADGRAKNRRVEVVIAEGEIKPAGN